MPKAKQSPCSMPGCGQLCHTPRCKRHTTKRTYKNDRNKPSWGMYNRRWEKTRAAFLAEHPLCAECERKGRATIANVVDHIIPHRGNQQLFDDTDNLQALCKRCHDRKTARGE